ncbi:MAG: CotH kinase family protein [Bacteroidota bacterium]
MQRFLLFLAGMFACHFTYAQFDGDQLFDQSYVHEIRFESPDPDFFVNLEQLFYDSSLIGNIPYLPGDVIIDGQRIDSSGIRVKGSLSGFAFKKSFKVDFNEFIDGQEYDGVRKFNMQNADFDASVQREAIAYDIFRLAGVKAPRTAFATLYINDEYHGVYILVEQVDKNFLRNYFATDEGILYKNKICSLEVTSGDPDYSFSDALFALDTDLPDSAFMAALEPILDTEAFLRYMLIENFINAVDNPIQVDCNYFLYYNHLDGRLTWIPWDFNFALFGGANFPLIYTNTNNRIYRRMLDHDVYRERYLELTCQLLDYNFVEERIHHFIDENADLIRDFVEIDPRYEFDFYEFDLETENIKNTITDRINSFQADLADLNYTCQPLVEPVVFQGIVINEFVASNDSLSGIADPAGGFPDWIEFYNNTQDSISLENCYLSDDKDFLKHWRFPASVTIAPDEYLIVFADRDIHEEGLHTDFKLKADTGSIYLIYENNTILDSVNYNQQIKNTPFARFPNGTGPFIYHHSTFGENNENITSVKNEIKKSPAIKIYPNPTAGELFIKMEKEVAGSNKTVNIYNSIGEIIFTKKLNGENDRINLNNLTDGIYLIEIKTKNYSFTEKFIINQ